MWVVFFGVLLFKYYDPWGMKEFPNVLYVLQVLKKPYSIVDSSISNVSDETKREEIREETHELEDTEQDELEEDDDYEDEQTE